MTRILVTGAGGFVGSCLLRRLQDRRHDVVTAGRAGRSGAEGGAPRVVVGEIGPQTDWTRALDGCDTVVHLAAAVPARGLSAQHYGAVNEAGTERLVGQARTAGVTRFIFVSTLFAALPVEVVGAVPRSDYGRSKREAEKHVGRFIAPGRVGVVLRPPLVYGALASGNWALLQKLAALPVALPFGAVRNRRSVIAVENLADAICRAVEAPDAPCLSGTYAVDDGAPVSLADILTWLRAGMGRDPGLFAVPSGLLAAAMRALGQGRAAQSLLGDFAADASTFQSVFGWKPVLATEEAVKAAGAAYLDARRRG